MNSLEYHFQKLQFQAAWGPKARMDFYTMLADIVADGVPSGEALTEIHARWASKKDAKAVMGKAVLEEMRGRSGEAARLGQALARWVPSMEAIAIDAGEQSGDLGNGLRMAANLTDVKSKISKAIIGEMIYPGVLLLLFTAILIGVKSFIMPVLGEIVPRADWPAVPAALGNFADHITVNLSVLFGTIGGVTLLYRASKGVWTGPMRLLADKFLFPWTLNRRVGGAIMMSCFAALIKAGVPFSEILKRLGKDASAWERWHLQVMSKRSRESMPEGDAMATELFEEDVRWMLGVYGKRSSFASALQGLSARQIEKTISKIQATMSLIKTLCMTGVALMIVWVYMSFMQLSLAARAAATSAGG